MAATDCLLNCLREVRLERFHRNFTERNLINCEQLSSLLVDDYSRFGVVSTDDRRRLFQLIHIIKAVQADGVYCQHGAAAVDTSQPKTVHQQTKSNISMPKPVHRKEELPDVTKHGLVLAQKVATAENAGNKKCPAAPSRQFIKPISNDCNYRVQYEQPPQKTRLHVTQETKVVTNHVAASAHNSSGTPKFNCRKTLTFSDSDLYSDGDDGNGFWQPAVTDIAKPLVQCQSNNSVTSSLSSRPSGLRPPQVVAASSVSSPRAFVIPVDDKPVTRHRSNGNHVSQAESQTSEDDHHGVTQNGHPNKKSSLRSIGSCQHAYFPTAKVPPVDEPETHIEQIYHSNGYNYGVPGSSVHSINKVIHASHLVI